MPKQEHWFFNTLELPRDKRQFEHLIRDEITFGSIKQEYDRDDMMKFNAKESISDLFHRVKAPQHLDKFVEEVKTVDKSLFKVLQLAAIGQYVSENLQVNARAPGRGNATEFAALRKAYQGRLGNLSGHKVKS